MPRNVERVAQMVHAGVFEVRGDGSIWRLARLTRTGRIVTLPQPRQADELRLDGYCHVRVGGFSALSHQVVWFLARGKIPAGLETNHEDGRRCHNVLSNLNLKTKGQNLQHAYDKLGRVAPAGERSGRAKLNRSKVGEIRRRHAAGESGRSLGREFGITHSTIQAIVSGRYWRDEMPEVA